MTGSTVYESWAQRVIFGSGTASEDVAAEVKRLGAERVLVVAAAAEALLADEVCADIEVAGTFSAIEPHVPIGVAQAVRAAATQHRADLLLSVGGGSTTGAAKAAALTTGLPILAVPTTYAGSEATPVWGLTEGARKVTGVDARVLPAVVVYDAALTLSLPTRLTVTSGLNALAHCVDSLWAPRRNMVSSALAVEGARAIVGALPKVARDGGDLGARRDILVGVYLGGVAFAGAGSGLHHKICHVLGGAFNLEHAAMHSIVLPHAVGFNLPFDPAAEQRLAPLFSPAEPFVGLVEWYAGLDAPTALSELGLANGDLELAADLITEQIPADNPRPVTRTQVYELLERAWRGDAPVLVPV